VNPSACDVKGAAAEMTLFLASRAAPEPESSSGSSFPTQPSRLRRRLATQTGLPVHEIDVAEVLNAD
jgi:hypothetical protein